MLPTEEDLKARILLPYLKSLGIGQGQIQLEKSFKLKLGRTTVEVGSKASRKSLGGRLDVLVKNTQGENLFVVELKASNQKLTDDDTKQAISYARLLDQIAPFVVVSNGKESKIYDSITMEELSDNKIGEQSVFWTSGRNLASTDDLRIRYEALKHFIGYSVENMQAFSRAQQAQRLLPLLGNALHHSKKYIPEIYIPRQKVRKAINLFMQGAGLSFALVGESGVGKTNEMCALADFLGKKHISLFFSASSLCKGLLETLTDEFNWSFSDQLREQELMSRLDELAKTSKRNVIILVDALDEADVPLFERSVSDFASRLGQFDGRIKLVVSVKSTEWQRFEAFRGDESALKTSLDTSWQKIEGDDDHGQQASRELKPFMLDPLIDQELDEVIPKYVDFFQLGGVPAGVLRDLCRSPFMMRVISEVYTGQGSLPQDMSEEKLIDAWLKKKLKVMANPSQVKLDLIEFTQSLYNKLCKPSTKLMTMPEEEKISESQICKMTSLSLSHELVTQGIIVRYEDSCGRASFSFYYGRVRDFIIARYLLELDNMDAQQFGDEAAKLLKNRILQSALIWHLQFAPYSHRQILRDHIGGEAAIFLSTYQRILDELVPGLKPNLEPFTAGEIGLAYQWHDGWLSYGLFPLGRNADKIIDLSDVSGRDEHELEMRRLGVSNWRGGGVNFGNIDPDIAAAEFALERIVKATEKGWLDETASAVIVKESIFAIASEHQSELELNKSNHQKILDSPLDLQWLDQRLQAFFGKRFYQDQWMQEQIEINSEYVTSTEASNGIISHHFTIDQLEACGLSNKADTEANQGKRFPITFYHGEEDIEVLMAYVECLKTHCSQIETTPLPEAAGLLRQHYNAQFPLSTTDVKSLLETLFKESLIAYRQLVAANFSGLLDSKRLMYTSVIVLYCPQKLGEHGWEITYSLIKQDKEAPSIRVFIQPEEATLAREGRQYIFRVGNESMELNSFHSTGLQSLLSPHNAAGFRVSSGSASSAHKKAPIRSRVYEWIKEDVNSFKASDLLMKLNSGYGDRG